MRPKDGEVDKRNGSGVEELLMPESWSVMESQSECGSAPHRTWSS